MRRSARRVTATSASPPPDPLVGTIPRWKYRRLSGRSWCRHGGVNSVANKSPTPQDSPQPDPARLGPPWRTPFRRPTGRWMMPLAAVSSRPDNILDVFGTPWMIGLSYQLTCRWTRLHRSSHGEAGASSSTRRRARIWRSAQARADGTRGPAGPDGGPGGSPPPASGRRRHPRARRSSFPDCDHEKARRAVRGFGAQSLAAEETVPGVQGIGRAREHVEGTDPAR